MNNLNICTKFYGNPINIWSIKKHLTNKLKKESGHFGLFGWIWALLSLRPPALVLVKFD